MTKIRLVIALLAVLILSSCTSNNSGTTGTSSAEKSGYTQITASEAMKMMEEESDYTIVDVRRADEFASGHIPGAINVPNETISEEADQSLPDKDKLLFVYCRSGNRSKQASQVLADLGYTKVYEFGGIIDWPGAIE